MLSPPKDGELTIPALDRQLEALAREFDTALAAAASGDSGDYSERFKAILAQQTELKAKRAQLEKQQTENVEIARRMDHAVAVMERADVAISEWDECQIRALVASIRVLSKDEVLVRLKNGSEAIQRLT